MHAVNTPTAEMFRRHCQEASRLDLSQKIEFSTFGIHSILYKRDKPCQPHLNHFTIGNLKWITRWKGKDGITLKKNFSIKVVGTRPALYIKTTP